jgi:hypothetical protein
MGCARPAAEVVVQLANMSTKEVVARVVEGRCAG